MDLFQNILIIVVLLCVLLLGRAVIDVLKLDAIRHGALLPEKKERKMWPFRRRNKKSEEIHVCTVPGVEMRMTVNGQTILQGDVNSFHFAAQYGSHTGEDWYDLLNGDVTSFVAHGGDRIGLEIRAIQTNGWGHGPDQHINYG